MTTVRIVDGMKYGFKLLGIFVAVALVCGAFIAGGVIIYQDTLTMRNSIDAQLYYGRMAGAGLMLAVGGLGLYGASVGFLHKFIADSVVAGIENAEPGTAAALGAGSAAAAGATADETDEDPTTGEESDGSKPDETPSADETSADAGSDPDPDEPDNTAESGSDQVADEEEEGIFGIDTSETRAEPTDPPQASPAEPDDREPDRVEPAEMAAPETETTGGERPSSPDERTWEREDTSDQTVDRPAETTETEEPDDHGYPDNVAANPPREGRGADADPEPEPDDDESERLWDGTDNRKDIDQVVSEATEPDPEADEAPASFDDTEPTDDGGTLERGSDDEPRTMDDAPGEFVAKPPVDSGSTDDPGEAQSDDSPDGDREVSEADDEVDPVEERPDEPYDDDIEDTSDEEGDWEPLDESDL